MDVSFITQDREDIDITNPVMDRLADGADPDQYDRWTAAAYRILDQAPLNERKAGSAERFVFAYDAENIAGIGTLRRDTCKDAVELFYLAVDPEQQGQGYGRALFDQTIDEAKKMAAEQDRDQLYMSVWDPVTGTYRDAVETVKEQNGWFTDRKVLEYCEQDGIRKEDLSEENTAMKHLAESAGFEQEETSSFRRTDYIKSVSAGGVQ